MASIGDLFGKGSIGEQFLVWGVLQQVIGAAIAPGVTEIQKLVFSAAPTVPLSAEQMANLVARGLVDHGTGKDAANDNGIGADDFDHLVDGQLSSVDLSTAVAAFQRQLIGAGSDDASQLSLAGALADAGVRPEWFPIVEKLAVQIPSIAEVMNAWLEGQIDEGEARTRYLAAGGDPTWFQTSYNANGQAPTPVEALTMLNRGIIPESGTGPSSISYEQAFLEGPWRNKWLQPFLSLRNYYPPPRTVTAMFHAGQLTHDQAATYLEKQGLSAELAAAYLTPSKTSTTTTAKTLSESQITALYKDKILTRAVAQSHLEALKYSASDADYLLQLIDVSSAAQAISQGVQNVRTLFENHRLTEQQAEAALVALEIPQAQAVEIVSTWAISQVAHVKTLTASEVVNAWYYTLITAEEAMTQLEDLGYSARDAWLLLSIKNKGKLAAVPEPA